MNYQLHYDRLIERARLRSRPEGYVERHHVIPKCLGGGNDQSNLVFLTAGEHYVAHQLLAKINRGNKGLIYAAWGMTSIGSPTRGDLSRNKLYGWLKKAMSISITGDRHHLYGTKSSLETRTKISKANKGRVLSVETRLKISKLLTGIVRSKDQRAHQSAIRIGKSLTESHKARIKESCKKGEDSFRYGINVSVETKQKLSESLKRYWKNKKESKIDQ